MNDMDFVEIARVVERKQATSLFGLALEHAPLADGWMIFGGPGSYVNKACGFGLERPLTDAELDGLVAFFVQRGVEPKAELGAFTPPALLAGLASRGFVLKEFENVLARPLSPSDEPRALLPQGWPPGVTVERVDPTDEAALREFVTVAMSGFFPEGAPMPDVFMEAGLKGARLPTYDSYVARVEGEVVGAGGCESSAGSTGLFGTSVKPAYRRRGVQQALIAARLERGREKGSRLAFIISGPGIPTERNAVRLGFGMAYTRVVLVKHGEGLIPSP
ncbi:MAG TPA: GNAT family N-acetyltransferase [Myxococcaceae bacterium]|nr:GNAT family N-acetyltransferase [Myxococcaceae bacterium]